MNYTSIFDVIGPNMIGPSSSHTAGACAISLMARRLFNEEITRVDFTLYGSFAKTYQGHGTDKALLGGILGFSPDDVRIRDAFAIAEERGVEFNFIEDHSDDHGHHPNTADILMYNGKGRTQFIRGESIGGGNAVITKLNGVDVELTGNYHTLVIEQVDKKGVLAFLTTVLSANDINIGTVRLFREGKGKKATTIIEVDSEIPTQVTAALYSMDAVKNVIIVPRIKMD